MAGSQIIPSMRYSDAPRMIDWICEAFGFEKRLVVPGPDDSIAHAQLVRGEMMIMLGSMRDDDFGSYVSVPRDIGTVTQSAYLVVDDPDALHDQAKQAGAEILNPPEDQDYGGRAFMCRDPEGQIWSFGNYDPWVEISPHAESDSS